MLQTFTSICKIYVVTPTLCIPSIKKTKNHYAIMHKLMNKHIYTISYKSIANYGKYQRSHLHNNFVSTYNYITLI